MAEVVDLHGKGQAGRRSKQSRTTSPTMGCLGRSRGKVEYSSHCCRRKISQQRLPGSPQSRSCCDELTLGCRRRQRQPHVAHCHVARSRQNRSMSFEMLQFWGNNLKGIRNDHLHVFFWIILLHDGHCSRLNLNSFLEQF